MDSSENNYNISMRKSFRLTAAFTCLFFVSMTGAAQKDYSQSKGLLKYVDPYIGSSFHGHVFVGTNVPYGMVQVGPNNIYKGWDWCSGYHYSDSILIGFSQTHLNGTGCSDLGDILIMPMNEIRTERGDQDNINNGYASKYSHMTEIVRPEYYSVMVERYNIKAEMTATDRVAFHRYTYPSGKPASILVDLYEGNTDGKANMCCVRKVDDYTVEGYRYSHAWSPNRKVYFVLKTDQKIENFTAFDGNVAKSKEQWITRKLKAALTFGNVKQVQIKVALSSVSCENAAMNLKAELNHWDFDKVVNASADRWNEQLQKIVVETTDETLKRIFYTAHYHTMITPSTYCDVNGEYRGMDDMIYSSPTKENYTTLSLWDTYRALQPLMTLTQSERVPGIINSMISIYHQQNKLPIWVLHNGETECMPGYSSMPIISDAILKGFEGFDYAEAYKAMKASTTYEKQNAIPFVLRQEFIPADSVIQATSIAMEYAVGDWGVAAVAKKMGKMDDYKEYAKRAKYYKHYFDTSINHIRPKLADGSWRTPYDPARSVHEGTSSDFCEGNGWQYTFFVPQDVYGLIDLFGGDKPFLEKLDSFFANNDNMGEGASADITGLIGQYAHGNEPSHHIAYMYTYAGQQWKTAEKIRFIMDEFYKATPDGIIGNEDCGQMSAWYVLSSMGFYQMNPADGIFVFGSPRFDKMSIKVRGGNTFTVEAENNTKENIYIQKVFLNGKPYKKTYITYDDIINGSTLKFVMGNKPNKAFGRNMADRPITLNQ